MRQWERAYRAKVRRTRKQHPLPPWAHVAWLLIFGVITWRYYTLFDLVPGDPTAMALLLGLQVVYFYVVVFGLLPAVYYVRWVWLSVVLQLLMLVVAFLLFAIILLVISVLRKTVVLNLDFSEPFHADIVNFGEMTFLYMALSPINALLFFYAERTLIKRRKNQRLWLWHHDANRRISLLNLEWLTWQMNPHLMSNLMTTLRDASRSAKPQQLVRATTYVGNLMSFYTQRILSTVSFRIKEEINQVKLLLAIHKLAGTRGGAARHIRLMVDAAVPNIAILPMTILVLVENMFRHATRMDKHHPATVEIMPAAGGICIRTDNFFDPQAGKPPASDGHGIAIQNIRRRLREAHPAATLDTEMSAGRFEVRVFIPANFIPLPAV